MTGFEPAAASLQNWSSTYRGTSAWWLGYFTMCAALPRIRAMGNEWLVEPTGIEPVTSDCKTDVFPLAPKPHS